ncbi:hypothetical protein TNCV_310711 [Trichonephila clavipes]|nr:hypothetical protein TNCV_310711 [Trichonephila clavipes]
MQVTVRFYSVPPQFRGGTPWVCSGASHPFFPSTNLTRGLVARWLFRVSPCHQDNIHLQTSMSSPGFEPRSYGPTVSVTNHFTGLPAISCIYVAFWQVIPTPEECSTSAMANTNPQSRLKERDKKKLLLVIRTSISLINI